MQTQARGGVPLKPSRRQRMDYHASRAATQLDWVARERQERDCPVYGAALREFQRDLETALLRLSASHRRAFLLHASGCNQAEIAGAMACTLGTAKSRVFYARERLQRLLMRHRDLQVA